MPQVTIENEPATRFLTSLCSLDADQVTSLLDEHAQVSIGSTVVAASTPRILKLLKRSMSSLISLQSTPAMIWSRDHVSVVEADVSCELLDGSRVEFPVTLILCFRDQRVSEVRLFTYEPEVPRLGSTRLAARLAASSRHIAPTDPVAPAPAIRTRARGFRAPWRP